MAREISYNNIRSDIADVSKLMFWLSIHSDYIYTLQHTYVSTN